jgi:hypothetical protein
LVIAPSIDCHDQSMPLVASYSSKPNFQNWANTPAATHTWNQWWAAVLEHRPVAFRAFHWQPVRSTKKMASMAFRGAVGGLWQPRGWGLPGGSNGSILFHSSSGIRH